MCIEIMCIESHVPTGSRMVGTALVLVSRGVTQLTRQTEVEPYVEGMGAVSMGGGTRVAPSQPENSRLGIGRTTAFPKYHREPRSQRTRRVRTQRVAKSQGPTIGRPVAVYAERGRRHKKPAHSEGPSESEFTDEGERKSQKDFRNIRCNEFPDKHINVAGFPYLIVCGHHPK